MKSQQESLSGVAYASAAFFIWGLSPIYWKVLDNIPTLEIIMHRTIWSFVFLLIILVFQRHGNEFMAAVKKQRTFLVLIPTTILLAFNWFIYIWAVNNEHILQASLGYFITPLVNVLLGMIFLRERLRPLQIVSLGLAGIAVLYLTVYYGKFPWIALSLAFAFGLYGLIRKVAPVSSFVGLSLEIFSFQGLHWHILYSWTVKMPEHYFTLVSRWIFSLWERLFSQLFRSFFLPWAQDG